MEENINKINSSVTARGYRVAEEIWNCETKEELRYLCNTLDSIIPKKYEQLTIVENLKPNKDRCILK